MKETLSLGNCDAIREARLPPSVEYETFAMCALTNNKALGLSICPWLLASGASDCHQIIDGLRNLIKVGGWLRQPFVSWPPNTPVGRLLTSRLPPLACLRKHGNIKRNKSAL